MDAYLASRIRHMSNTNRLCVNLSDPQAAWLREEAERLGISVAELLRRIIDKQRGEG